MVFIKILIMFFASLFFPILTLLLYLLSSDTDDRFRKFWKLFVATMFIILLLSCLLATIPSMSVFSELILKVFSNFNTIVIYGSVILLIPQALLYSKWYTTKRGDTAQYCWSWLKYCATLIFFWYFLPFFLSLIGFKVSLLELTVGIPILVTAIYMFLVERPPQTKKRNIIDKILGNAVSYTHLTLPTN